MRGFLHTFDPCNNFVKKLGQCILTDKIRHVQSGIAVDQDSWF